MTSTTRRAILAGLAAAPVASLPAIAEPNSALAEAIERHRAAYAAFSACNGPDEAIADLSDIECEAVDALAMTPCDDDGFLQKMRYLLKRHKRLWGDEEFLFYDSPSIMLALNLRFNASESQQ